MAGTLYAIPKKKPAVNQYFIVKIFDNTESDKPICKKCPDDYWVTIKNKKAPKKFNHIFSVFDFLEQYIKKHKTKDTDIWIELFTNDQKTCGADYGWWRKLRIKTKNSVFYMWIKFREITKAKNSAGSAALRENIKQESNKK